MFYLMATLQLVPVQPLHTHTPQSPHSALQFVNFVRPLFSFDGFVYLLSLVSHRLVFCPQNESKCELFSTNFVRSPHQASVTLNAISSFPCTSFLVSNHLCSALVVESVHFIFLFSKIHIDFNTIEYRTSKKCNLALSLSLYGSINLNQCRKVGRCALCNSSLLMFLFTTTVCSVPTADHRHRRTLTAFVHSLRLLLQLLLDSVAIAFLTVEKPVCSLMFGGTASERYA